MLDLEPLAAGVGDHVRVEIDTPRLDPRLAEQGEKLAPAATDVEHGRRVAEVVHVGALTLADALRGAPHPALEGEVIGDARRRGGHRRRQSRSCGGSRPLAALEPGEPLIELDRPSGLGGRGGTQLCQARGERFPSAFLALGQRIGKAQHRCVETALVRRERLDVPAHCLAQNALRRTQDETAGAAPGARSGHERPFGTDGPQLLGGTAPGRVRVRHPSCPRAPNCPPRREAG